MGDNEADLGCNLPWRRSLRASQERRHALARRRRRALRARAGAVLAVAGLTFAAAGAVAQEVPGPDASEATAAVDPTTKRGIRAIQRALGVTADGVLGPRTRAAVRRFQRRNDLAVDGIPGPKTLRALGLGDAADAADVEPGPAATPGASAQKSEASATLERIARCESGGDPTAVSADGSYRGKYQFDRETWERLGGTGDPAAAPEAEQDRIAAELLAQRGTAPWPTCA